MSQVKDKKDKTADNGKLIHIRTYLISKGYKGHHLNPMIKFAGRKVYATKDKWEEIFSKY